MLFFCSLFFQWGVCGSASIVSPERVVGTNYLNIIDYIIIMEVANVFCAYM